MNIKIRAITPKDLPHLLPIEIDCYPSAYWEADDFRSVLSDKKNHGFLIENQDDPNHAIVAFAVYSLEQGRMTIVNIAVSSNFRRQKLGLAIMERLMAKVGSRKEICLTISDRNLDAQLFFRAMGFKAVRVERNFYGRDHDGYNFVYNVGSPYKYDRNKQLDEICQGK